ncbi:hypothetical protein AKJ50_01000, partial [candidate division MSBL1 archaeon SCGC-AAA382A13]
RRVAELHSKPQKKTEKKSKVPTHFDLSELPETELLFYKEPYKREFTADVLWKEGDYVVLDRTAFYPEGGGQPSDDGVLKSNGDKFEVLDVQKSGDVVLHKIDSENGVRTGEKVKGEINWEKRSAYMRHHTATHILLGALRSLLGDHVWQHGVQKGEESSRLDVSHHKRISEEKIQEIEKLANKIVFQDRKVNSLWMDRNEAEKKYGHSLYQGGVVPGRKIRIVDIEDWNAQACSGTHCTHNGEVGLIKIINRERIQDGVERLVFASGLPVLESLQEQEQRIKKSAETLRTSPDEIDKAVQKLFDQWKSAKKEVDNLRSRVADLKAEKLEKNSESFNNIQILAEKFEDGDSDELIQIGEILTNNNKNMVVILASGKTSANIIAMAGEKALEEGINCGEIASEAAKSIEGGGGGKPELGQGGGGNVEKLEEAIKMGVKICKKQASGDNNG